MNYKTQMKKIKCGDANPEGNVEMFFKGGCKKELDFADAYRCTGCGGYFHLDCIFEHFELEAGHDYSRNALRKIKDLLKIPPKVSLTPTDWKKIMQLVNEGLERKPVKKSFGFPFKNEKLEKFRFLGNEKDPWTKERGIKKGQIYKIKLTNGVSGFNAHIHTEGMIIVCPYKSQIAFYNNWLKIK